jgi:NifU-like protein involved in Fe-S cluster formation
MSDPLYKKELLRLAADAAGAGRLSAPDTTGAAHNPACGDKVVVDLVIEDGRIAGIAHDTKACVLTQASAAIIGGELVGLSHMEIVTLHESVRAMLDGGEAPAAPFDVYTVFDGVADHRNRHRCVLLPIEAVLAAFAASEAADKGRKGP